MAYFSYHNKIKKMIRDGKLISYSFSEDYHGIRPALLLFFNDEKYNVMPVRKERWAEYLPITEKEKAE